jgi:hypothetical protein
VPSSGSCSHSWSARLPAEVIDEYKRVFDDNAYFQDVLGPYFGKVLGLLPHIENLHDPRTSELLKDKIRALIGTVMDDIKREQEQERQYELDAHNEGVSKLLDLEEDDA